jgi:hypothetical protein
MNSFGSQSTLKVGNKSYEIFRLKALEAKGLPSIVFPTACACCWKTCCGRKTARA